MSERPPYRLEPMTERDAAAISAWRYPPPYDAYDWLPWEQAAAERRDYADPDVRERQYRAVRCGDELCGFVQWFPLAAEEGAPIVRLGLGLKPDWCGRGRGAGFARFAAQATAERHPGHRIDLEVAKDNARAIAAYEKAGFRAVDEYDLPLPGRGIVPVVNMIWPFRPTLTTETDGKFSTRYAPPCR